MIAEIVPVGWVMATVGGTCIGFALTAWCLGPYTARDFLVVAVIAPLVWLGIYALGRATGLL